MHEMAGPLATLSGRAAVSMVAAAVLRRLAGSVLRRPSSSFPHELLGKQQWNDELLGKQQPQLMRRSPPVENITPRRLYSSDGVVITHQGRAEQGTYVADGFLPLRCFVVSRSFMRPASSTDAWSLECLLEFPNRGPFSHLPQKINDVLETYILSTFRIISRSGFFRFIVFTIHLLDKCYVSIHNLNYVYEKNQNNL